MSITKYIFVFIFFMSFSKSKADDLTHDDLQPGTCISDPFSKIYLTDPLSKINLEVQYSCKITCMNQKNINFEIAVLHTESNQHSVTGLSEMDSLKCKNVGIEVVRTELGFILNQKIHSYRFYAQTSGFPELVNWAKINDGLIPAERVEEMKQQMKKIFLQVGVQYKSQVGQSLVIQTFADELIALSGDGPVAESLLNHWLEKIKNKYHPVKPEDIMLFQFISGYAGFLITD